MGNPTLMSLPGEPPGDGEPWVAAAYGVTQEAGRATTEALQGQQAV